MNKNILSWIIISIISIFIILFIINQAEAYQAPEFKDGLTGLWHPGALCISCHYALGTTEAAKAISSGCRCHEKIYQPPEVKSVYEVDMPKILDLHKTFVCVRCHISPNKNDASFQDLHSLKRNLECTQCHIINDSKIKVPEKTKCFECHGADPHVVHGDKTQNLCPACHGEFGVRYLQNTLQPSEQVLLPTNLTRNQTVVVREYPTIADFIANIIKSIFNF